MVAGLNFEHSFRKSSKYPIIGCRLYLIITERFLSSIAKKIFHRSSSFFFCFFLWSLKFLGMEPFLWNSFVFRSSRAKFPSAKKKSAIEYFHCLSNVRKKMTTFEKTTKFTGEKAFQLPSLLACEMLQSRKLSKFRKKLVIEYLRLST